MPQPLFKKFKKILFNFTVILIIPLFLPGCSCCPVISAFYARPCVVCPGEDVELYWRLDFYERGDQGRDRCNPDDAPSISVINESTGDAVLDRPVVREIDGGVALESIPGENRIENVVSDTPLVLRVNAEDQRCKLVTRGLLVGVADGVDDFVEPTFGHEVGEDEDDWTDDYWKYEFDDYYFSPLVTIREIHNLTDASFILTIETEPRRPMAFGPGDVHMPNWTGSPNCAWEIRTTNSAEHDKLMQMDAILRIFYSCD